jgi:hypothetical protein
MAPQQSLSRQLWWQQQRPHWSKTLQQTRCGGSYLLQLHAVWRCEHAAWQATAAHDSVTGRHQQAQSAGGCLDEMHGGIANVQEVDVL